MDKELFRPIIILWNIRAHLCYLWEPPSVAWYLFSRRCHGLSDFIFWITDFFDFTEAAPL